MAGKERTVYFFEVIEVFPDESVTEWDEEAVPSLFEHIGYSDAEQRQQVIRRRKYEGEMRTEASLHLDYLYLGKLRPGADWPDIRDAQGAHASLASTGVVGALIEPAYLVSVTGTGYIAIMRSSGGPTFSAIGSWLSAVGGYEQLEQRLELRPYVRKDQLERLNESIGVSRLHLKVDSDVLSDAAPSSETMRAIKAVQDTGAGGVSVEMIVSYGNSIPDAVGADRLADGVRELISSVPYTKAKATLLRGESGQIVKDYVDFAADRVTFTELVGDSEDEEPTPRAVLTAMSEAIARFRDRIAASNAS